MLPPCPRGTKPVGPLPRPESREVCRSVRVESLGHIPRPALSSLKTELRPELAVGKRPAHLCLDIFGKPRETTVGTIAGTLAREFFRRPVGTPARAKAETLPHASKGAIHRAACDFPWPDLWP